MGSHLICSYYSGLMYLLMYSNGPPFLGPLYIKELHMLDLRQY